MPNESNTVCHILITGPIGQKASLQVGKTTLFRALSGDFKPLGYKSTVGYDFITVQLGKPNDSLPVSIWDSAGSSLYCAERMLFAPDVILFCLDDESYQRQQDITEDIEQINTLCTTNKNSQNKTAPLWVFVVTKKDEKEEVNDLILPEALKKMGFKKICYTSNQRPESISLLKKLLFQESVKIAQHNATTPMGSDTILESLKQKTPHNPQVQSALDTLFKQFEAASLNVHYLREFQSKYETLLEQLAEQGADQSTLVNGFVTGIEEMLSASGTKSKYAIGALGTALLVALLAGCIGFAIGFACGIWAGPAALLTGLLCANLTAILLVSAASGAGVCSGVGVAAYGLFQQPEWRVDLNPLKQALNLPIMG